MRTFINLTNHPSNKWGEKQITACKGAVIVDIPFPNVASSMTSGNVKEMARDILIPLMVEYNKEDTLFLVQGEMSLTYQLVSMLKTNDYKVVVACSERNTKEVVNEDGTTTKVATFNFVQFREY